MARNGLKWRNFLIGDNSNLNRPFYVHLCCYAMLATLIASVKLHRNCGVGLLPDTRKCYNSDQIIGANGY